MPGRQNPRLMRTRRLAQLMLNRLIEAGRGTLMLAPIIAPPELIPSSKAASSPSNTPSRSRALCADGRTHGGW
jgi:hypothetical protein